VWTSLADIILEKYGGPNVLFRSNYTIDKLKGDIPAFYREVLSVWSHIPKVKGNEFMWNNSKIIVQGKSVFYPNFFQAGLWYTKDIWNTDNLDIVPFNEWVNRGVNPGEYLKWRGVVEQSRLFKNEVMANLHSEGDSNDIVVLCDNSNVALSNLKSKDVYHILLQNVSCDHSEANLLYSRMYNLNDEDWKTIHVLPGRCTKDAKLRELQYKILQRYICLNPLLVKMGVKNDGNCTFCREEKETIEHFYLHCEKSKSLWRELSVWWERNTEIPIDIDEKAILFGELSNNQYSILINNLLLIAKQYLYTCRYSETMPTFQGFLSKVNVYALTEKNSAVQNDKYMYFLLKWERVLQAIDLNSH
jgi:hypothetical protein